MITREEILKDPEYWFDQVQNELFRQVSSYMDSEGINQTELATVLGVSKGYVSQILNGSSNFTMKKLIEIAMSIGKVPEISYTPLKEKVEEESSHLAYTVKFNLGGTSKPQTMHIAYRNNGQKITAA